MKATIFSLWASLLLLATPVYAAPAKTFFDHLEQAWAVAEVRLLRPLNFRDGRLLAFPGQLTDVAYARLGRPQTILLIHEMSDRGSEPFFSEGDVFFAPIKVLADHSYWRDNLPPTKRHAIPGGRRYVFRGKEIAEAKRVAKNYTRTFGEKMPERAVHRLGAVVSALASEVERLRTDAVRHLASYPTLARDLDGESRKRLVDFIKSDLVEDQRVMVIAAIGRAGVAELAAELETLARGDGLDAVAAMQSLDLMGRPRSTNRLIELSSDTYGVEVRSYAAVRLGQRSASDSEARSRALEVLGSSQEGSVRAAAALGLGRSGDKRVVEPLREALWRGDEASRSAAAAIADIGGPLAADILQKAILEGPSEAMIGSVMAIVALREQCKGCLAFLRKQYESHKEEAIRDLIGIMLEVHKKHEH